jgi:hypothetical protein
MPARKVEPEETDIVINGKSYPIRFSLGALKALQRDHGINLLRGSSAADMLDPEKLAVVLFYGMRGFDPKMTLEWVEESVDTRSLMGMIPGLSAAISGGKTSSSPNAPAPEPSGIGLPSGASDGTTSDLVNGRSGV